MSDCPDWLQMNGAGSKAMGPTIVKFEWEKWTAVIKQSSWVGVISNLPRNRCTIVCALVFSLRLTRNEKSCTGTFVVLFNLSLQMTLRTRPCLVSSDFIFLYGDTLTIFQSTYIAFTSQQFVKICISDSTDFFANDSIVWDSLAGENIQFTKLHSNHPSPLCSPVMLTILLLKEFLLIALKETIWLDHLIKHACTKVLYFRYPWWGHLMGVTFPLKGQVWSLGVLLDLGTAAW